MTTTDWPTGSVCSGNNWHLVFLRFSGQLVIPLATDFDFDVMLDVSKIQNVVRANLSHVDIIRIECPLISAVKK